MFDTHVEEPASAGSSLIYRSSAARPQASVGYEPGEKPSASSPMPVMSIARHMIPGP